MHIRKAMLFLILIALSRAGEVAFEQVFHSSLESKAVLHGSLENNPTPDDHH